MIEIFIDETGDNGLNFEPGKSQPWFLLAAVIVNSENIELLTSKLDELSRKYLRGNEIKSKKIQDDNIRQSILKELPRDIWHGLILKVDKTLLGVDSFKWKQTFYKRVPRQLYSYLITAHDTAIIYPDPTGGDEFEKSLKEYIINRAPLSLFNQTNLEFRHSSESRPNQLADLCSGTLFKDIRDGTRNFDLVSDLVKVKTWPISLRDFDFSDVSLSDKVNEPLFRASVNFAKSFIERYESADELLKKDQVRPIQILLDEVMNGDPFRYIPTRILRNELTEQRLSEIGDYYFRTKVIGKLRTSDVLIVSNRKGGYKIPVNQSEIEEYFKNMTEKIEPMMYKASAVAQHVHTILGIDLLADPKWVSLNRSE